MLLCSFFPTPLFLEGAEGRGKRSRSLLKHGSELQPGISANHSRYPCYIPTPVGLGVQEFKRNASRSLLNSLRCNELTYHY